MATQRDIIAYGHRMGAAGVPWDTVAAALEIRRLNGRAVSAWTRLNNIGGNQSSDWQTKQQARVDRYVERATQLAADYHLTLDTTGGLWWFVSLDIGARIIDITCRY